jgi:DNA-binding transcriptional LysR family regulator
MLPFDATQRTLNRTAIDNQTLLSGNYWGELRVFLAVAKTRSYSKAAELLGSSQPTVSRAVKRLQDVVGSQLIIANYQGVILTSAGEHLAQAIANLDQRLYDITADLKSERNDADGHVRISVTDGLSAVFIAPNLRSFAAKYPKIDVSIKMPNSLIELRNNQTDMMVGFIPTETSELEICPLGTLHLVPMATVDYVETYGLPTLETISNHVFVQTEFHSSRSGHWDPWLNLIARGKRVHSCDGSFGHAMAIRSGLGIGLFGSYVSIWPSVIPLDELGVHIPIRLYAIALRERLASKPVGIAFEWLKELLSPGNPWLTDNLSFNIQPGRHDYGMRLLSNL